MAYPQYSYERQHTFTTTTGGLILLGFIIIVILAIFAGLIALILDMKRRKEESYINRFVFHSKLLFSSDLSMYRPINKKKRRSKKEKSSKYYSKLPPTPDEMV